MSSLTLDGHQLKKRMMAWLASLEDNSGGDPRYPIALSSPYTTLMSSCFAVFVYELFGELPNLSPRRIAAWREYLAAFQDAETGLFIDPLLRPEDVTSDAHDWTYLTYQSTFFALSALDALNGQARHPLHFIEPFRSTSAIRTWLAGLDWSNPWLESNRVMFVASFLIQASEKLKDTAAEEAVQALFDWLDEQQEPGTGFWGVRHGASLLNAMAGAFHFYFLYFYLERPVRYPEAIIESTLTLQEPDGLFHPAGGGEACLDLDAVDILVKVSLVTDYRAAEVKKALTRAYTGLLQAQNEDGGFAEARNRPRPAKSWKRRVGEAMGLDRLLGRPYRSPDEVVSYSGWSRMQYSLRESNLWATWCRPLALALISMGYPGEFLDDIPWRFRRSPALGWHDPEAVLRCYKMKGQP
jgi:hypothetical protein